LQDITHSSENNISIETSRSQNIVLELGSDVVNLFSARSDVTVDSSRMEAPRSTGYRYYFIPPSPSEYGDSPDCDFPSLLNISSSTQIATQATKQQVSLFDIGNSATSQWNGPFKQFFSSIPTGVITTTDAEVHSSENQSSVGHMSQFDISTDFQLRSLDDDSTFFPVTDDAAVSCRMPNVYQDVSSYNIASEGLSVDYFHRLTNGELMLHEGHISDSEDEDGQQLYDHYIGHYSKAGRGYPHGLRGCCETLTGEDMTSSAKTGNIISQGKLSQHSLTAAKMYNNLDVDKCTRDLTEPVVINRELNDLHR